MSPADIALDSRLRGNDDSEALSSTRLTVRFTDRAATIRIIGARYWRKGKAIYDRENQIHQ